MDTLLLRLVLLTLAIGMIFGKNAEDSSAEKYAGQRDKKVFSLFSIVTFKNQACSSLDPLRNGTCFTTTECQNKGGVTSGNCAAGFGVCCLFLVSSTSTAINQNCTYIRNPNFPAAYDTSAPLTFTVNKCSNDVCSIRLDFLQFAINGPSSATEVNGGECTDSFTATGSSGKVSPVICGINTGEHIYVEMGTDAGNTGTLNFNFATAASTTRIFEMKATQIPCASNLRPPEGCLQYHTTLTGQLTTFNWQSTDVEQHLASQDYSICIKPQPGYCCIAYSLCPAPADAMVDPSWELDYAADAMVKTGTNCVKDYIGIQGANQQCQQGAVSQVTALCGSKFGTVEVQKASAPEVCTCQKPFVVSVFTDNLMDTMKVAGKQRGVCLNYRHIPCTAN